MLSSLQEVLMRKQEWDEIQRMNAWVLILLASLSIPSIFSIMFTNQLLGATLGVGAICFVVVPTWIFYQKGPYRPVQRWRYHIIPACLILCLGSKIQTLVMSIMVAVMLECVMKGTIQLGILGTLMGSAEKPGPKTPDDCLDLYCDMVFANAKGTTWEQQQLVTIITRRRMEEKLSKNWESMPGTAGS